jgi:hypothetical protein
MESDEDAERRVSYQPPGIANEEIVSRALKCLFFFEFK